MRHLTPMLELPDDLTVQQPPEILYDQPDRLSVATWRVGTTELFECNMHAGTSAAALTLIAQLIPDDATMLDAVAKFDGDAVTILFQRAI